MEVQDKRKRVLCISTGSKSVDAVLGGESLPPSASSLSHLASGGIMSQSISEGTHTRLNLHRKFSMSIHIVYGEFRTGKTQLAHTMSVVTQLPPELGGASGKVTSYTNLTYSHRSNPVVGCIYRHRRYILLGILQINWLSDMTGTFRPDRIRSIAERFGVDGNMALENILYGTHFNFTCVNTHSELFWKPVHSTVNIRCGKHLWVLGAIRVNVDQMELINECSMRFAEDKDFRLLVRISRSLSSATHLMESGRLWTVLWRSSALTFLAEGNSARGSKRCV